MTINSIYLYLPYRNLTSSFGYRKILFIERQNAMFKEAVSIGVKMLFTMMALLMLTFPTSTQNDDGVIDNCCYVNRECTTPDQWVNGWYAFVNNLCPTTEEQLRRANAPRHQIDPWYQPAQDSDVPPPPPRNNYSPQTRNYISSQMQNYTPQLRLLPLEGLERQMGSPRRAPGIKVPMTRELSCKLLPNLPYCQE